MPESTEELVAIVGEFSSPGSRARIMRLLRARVPRLESSVKAITDTLDGPDPEAAIVHLALLRDACERALAAALSRKP